MLESKERGKEAWLAAEVEEEEVIEDNPAFQHPLILPQLFLFGCLAVEDICGSQSQCEKKKNSTSHNLQTSDASRLEISSWRTFGPGFPRPLALAAVARGIRSRCAT